MFERTKRRSELTTILAVVAEQRDTSLATATGLLLGKLSVAEANAKSRQAAKVLRQCEVALRKFSGGPADE